MYIYNLLACIFTSLESRFANALNVFKIIHVLCHHHQNQTLTLTTLDPANPVFEGDHFLEFVPESGYEPNVTIQSKSSLETSSAGKQENAELRRDFARFEKVSIERHETLLDEIKKIRSIYWDTLNLLDPSMSKKALDSRRIIKNCDFVAPEWPIATSEQLIELNMNLAMPEYRDQVVIALKYYQHKFV